MQNTRRSLTFSQTTHSLSRPINVSDINPSTFSFGFQAANSFGTTEITNKFNTQFSETFSSLNCIRQEQQHQVNELLASSPGANDTLRNKGVELAWKYEQAEISMGGKGTSDWTNSQRQEILDSGRVRGAEGHHINSVGDNPSQQANPDNIRFAIDRTEHHNMHGGAWRNQTSGDNIDRNTRLEKTNDARVFKNELTGIGAAAVIGLGVGFTMGFVVTLAQSGISTESLKNATLVGSKTGAEGAALGVVNHIIVRGVGEMATNALHGVIKNLGLTVTDNIVKMCNIGVIGGLAIVVFSVYQFTKLKLQGYSARECLLRVGKSAAFSATVLLVSIVAQGLWGGYAGIVVSLSFGVIVVAYKVLDNQHHKQISEKVHVYMIQKCEPVMLGV